MKNLFLLISTIAFITSMSSTYSKDLAFYTFSSVARDAHGVIKRLLVKENSSHKFDLTMNVDERRVNRNIEIGKNMVCLFKRVENILKKVSCTKERRSTDGTVTEIVFNSGAQGLFTVTKKTTYRGVTKKETLASKLKFKE